MNRKISRAVREGVAAYEARVVHASRSELQSQPQSQSQTEHAGELPATEAGGVNAMTARDPSLAALIGALNKAIDPHGVWDRVKSLSVDLDIGGALVRSSRPGIFSSPGARAEVSLEKEQVTFFEVPGPRARTICSIACARSSSKSSRRAGPRPHRLHGVSVFPPGPCNAAWKRKD